MLCRLTCTDSHVWGLKAVFHLQKIFRGQKPNATEKLMGMCMCHVNGRFSVPFCSEESWAKFNFFCRSCIEKHRTISISNHITLFHDLLARSTGAKLIYKYRCFWDSSCRATIANICSYFVGLVRKYAKNRAWYWRIISFINIWNSSFNFLSW